MGQGGLLEIGDNLRALLTIGLVVGAFLVWRYLDYRRQRNYTRLEAKAGHLQQCLDCPHRLAAPNAMADAEKPLMMRSDALPEKPAEPARENKRS